MANGTGGAVTDAPSERPVLKIPYSLLGVIYSIFAAMAGLWYSLNQSNNDQKVQLVAVGKDVTALTKIVGRLEKQLDEDRISRYTSDNAVRDFSIVNAQLVDHEARIRKLEERK